MQILSRLFGRFNKEHRASEALHAKIDKLQTKLKAAEQQLAQAEQSNTRLRRWVEAELDRFSGTLKTAQQTIRESEEGLRAAQELVNTMEKITIPGLVEANGVMLARWEAQTAIETMRRVVNTPNQNGET